jgi:hypothetical protein
MPNHRGSADDSRRNERERDSRNQGAAPRAQVQRRIFNDKLAAPLLANGNQSQSATREKVFANSNSIARLPV